MNVLVTGVGGGGIGEQVVKTLRISKNHYYIFGTDTSEFSKGLYECDEKVIMLHSSCPDYIESLLYTCKINNIKVLIPGSEPELKIISKNRNLFAGIFLPINTENVLKICFNKNSTNTFLQDNGFKTIKSIVLDTKGLLSTINFFPVVIKPIEGGSGSSNVFIAQTQSELNLLLEYISTFSEKVLVQEYIGIPEEEYTVGVLTSMTGKIINSIAVHRNLSGLSNKIKIENKTNRKDLGKYLQISSGITQGTIGKFENICNTCEKIALKLKSCGPLNIQCRVVNGEVYVFEINPRFSGTTSFRAMVGFNEPDILIREQLFNENIEPYFLYKSGDVMRGLTEVFIERTI